MFKRALLLLIIYSFILCKAQYTSQTFPDPRIDPLNCRVTLPGPLCDPSGIIPQNERSELAAKITQLLVEASTLANTSPACRGDPSKKLEIIVAVIEKIGTVPLMPVDIEKFTKSLKSRLQNFKDVSTCDNTVVIVNSKNDRQVYTVAGRDVKLTKDMLKTAFTNNIHHFKEGTYANGLFGMVQFLVEAYKIVHSPNITDIKIGEFSKSTEDFLINGIEAVDKTSKKSKKPETVLKNSVSEPPSETSFFGNHQIEKPEDESDQLWVDVIQQGVGRCGNDQDQIVTYVRAIIEESMSLSLRLIKDLRYAQVEEALQEAEKNGRTKAEVWQEARIGFIDDLYKRYMGYIKYGSADKKCPAKVPNLRFVKKHWNRL